MCLTNKVNFNKMSPKITCTLRYGAIMVKIGSEAYVTMQVVDLKHMINTIKKLIKYSISPFSAHCLLHMAFRQQFNSLFVSFCHILRYNVIPNILFIVSQL